MGEVLAHLDANWVIVGLTAGLLAVAVLQWLTYRQQARLMRAGLEETRIAAQAAKDSADATKQNAIAADATQRLNEIAFRPWVNLWALQLEMSRTDDILLGVFTFRNSGGTPAFIEDIRIGISTGRHQVPSPGERIPGLPKKIPKFLVKDEDTNWRYAFESPRLGPKEWDEISEGRLYFLLVGIIEYRDAMGNTYWTKFAREYDAGVNKPGTAARFAYPDIEGASDAT